LGGGKVFHNCREGKESFTKTTTTKKTHKRTPTKKNKKKKKQNTKKTKERKSATLDERRGWSKDPKSHQFEGSEGLNGKLPEGKKKPNQGGKVVGAV